MAGGRNIVDDTVGPDSSLYYSVFDVDPELIMEQNPDFIFIHASTQLDAAEHGYETDDTSAMIALRDDLMDRPELSDVAAVKNGNVYVIDDSIIGGAGQTIIGAMYAAKLMHPDIFGDIDPRSVHQEYVDKFCRIDFDVSEHGTFVYPVPEEW